jgi:hypothetical protein
MNITVEKIALRSIYVTKKRYGAYQMEDYPHKKWKKSIRGLDSVRRDKPLMQSELIDRILDDLLVVGDISKAEQSICAVLDLLANNQIPLEKFVISQEVKSEDSYDDPDTQANMSVVKKQRERNPGFETEVGQRVEFVYVCGKASDKRCELAEDFHWVRENSLKVDRLYYLERLKKAVNDIMVFCIQDPERLFGPYEALIKRQTMGVLSINEILGVADKKPLDQIAFGRLAATPSECTSGLKRKTQVGIDGSLVDLDAPKKKQKRKVNKPAKPNMSMFDFVDKHDEM